MCYMLILSFAFGVTAVNAPCPADISTEEFKEPELPATAYDEAAIQALVERLEVTTYDIEPEDE